MFPDVTVVDQPAVEKFIADNNICMVEIVDHVRAELLAADFKPNMRLSLYQFSDCQDPKHLKLHLECIVPEEIDVEYVCHSEDEIVVSTFSKFKFFGLVIIGLCYS